MSTLHRTVSPSSNIHGAGQAGKTIYTPSAGALARLWQLASGQAAHGAAGALVEDQALDLRAGRSGVKRGWRVASALGLGILLIGLTAQAAPPAASLATQCSGDDFQVDLAGLEDANLAQDPEERVEQLRDWIWPVLAARLEATAGLEGLLIGSATQPLLRDDALAHVLDHPVGSTRSGIARDGTVVVMVQVEEPAAMQEALLEAIDQESLHLGAVPRRTLVYRYAIDARTDQAALCRLGSFDARWIESQQQGFRRATVRQARDLGSFLDGGVDLLSAQCTASGLEVTGRVRSRTRTAPMTVEHVASLYQIQYVPIEQLGVSRAQLSAEDAAWLAQVASLVENVGERELRQAKAELDPDIWNMLVHVRAWRQRHPRVSTEDLLLSWMAQRELGQRLGFSLDPKIRARDVVRDIDALVEALGDARKLAALLYAWRVDPEQAEVLVRFIEEEGLAGSLARSLAELRGTLRQSSDHDALGILAKAMNMQGSDQQVVVAATAGLLKEHAAYQCARYDGPLQGTRTGMTMFYTDLLMKLWGGDRLDAAPDGLIPGFESVVAHDLSAAHCTEEEEKYPHTRAWLGLREEQYAREDAQRVRFAPVTTRVFSLGSALGAGYSEEVEAGAYMRRLHRWWNAHYARVAEWEPQYELLNQIMKWSVVVQAAALAEDQSCMGFLDQVPVDRSQRFDQWVERSPDLRWRGPVPLVKQGDEPTECLPVLRTRSFSHCGSDGDLSGGVSAASKATVAAKSVVRARRAPEVGRLDNMSPAAPKLAPDGRLRYDAVSRPDGKLTGVEIDPGKRTLSAHVDTAQSQRGKGHSYGVGGKDGERQVTGVKKWWRLDKGKLEGRDTLDARQSTFGVAHLRADDVAGRVVHPRVTPEATAQMRSIGEEAARLLDGGK
ncbi:MAG TPA: hypothetical protein VNM90_13725, partial [Haliangium sp.]|nr:hypothetical protein [Haliangium sp.]